MESTDLAWLAGLLEGEGCFGIFMKTSTTGEPYPTFRITLKMCDEDVVSRAHHITGLGRVTGPFIPGNPKWSPVWTRQVNKRDDVFALCKALEPWMGERRTAKLHEIYDAYAATGRPQWRHGTRQGYEVHKCKCDLCTASNTLRHKNLREAA